MLPTVVIEVGRVVVVWDPVVVAEIVVETGELSVVDTSVVEIVELVGGVVVAVVDVLATVLVDKGVDVDVDVPLDVPPPPPPPPPPLPPRLPSP